MLLLTAAAGCASPSANEEPRANDSGGVSQSGSAAASLAVPTVPHKLDASRYITAPCSVLSSEQLSSFGMSGPGDRDTSSGFARYAGPTCGWTNREAMTGIGVGFTTANRNGLADLYRGHANGQFAYFEPITVEGYPGVLADLTDSRDNGTCDANVAVNDHLTFVAHLSGGNGPQSCEDAKRLAAAVLRTIEGNG